MELAEKILNGLDIPKPQRDFLLTLYPTILTVRGKVNFRNLSRYSDLSEQTHPAPESSSVSSGLEKWREQKKGPASRSSKKKQGPSSKKKSRASTSSEETLIDAYLAHLGEVQPHLLDIEKDLVVDGYFAKKKWIDGVDGFGLHTVDKLRCDTDMRYFYTGPKREMCSSSLLRCHSVSYTRSHCAVDYRRGM